MPPVIPNSNDRITPAVVKWVVFPFTVVTFLLMALDLQINQWKCSREAKRQGYLEGEYYPAYRFTPAECDCKKKLKPDGTIDTYAKLVIDLQN